MSGLIDAVGQWVIALIGHWGYVGVVFLMGIESLNIPLPSEIVMPFAGFLVSQGRLNLHLVALSGALGCLWGSVVSYVIGYYGGEPFVRRYGRYFFITAQEFASAQRWSARWGNALFFVGRLLPVVRTFISLPAGVLRVPFWSFALVTFIGSWIWSYALALLGAALGDHWDTLGPLWHKFDVVIVALGALVIGVYVWQHIRKVKTASV